MGFIDNLWNEGKLPEVETVVSWDKENLTDLLTGVFILIIIIFILMVIFKKVL